MKRTVLKAFDADEQTNGKQNFLVCGSFAGRQKAFRQEFGRVGGEGGHAAVRLSRQVVKFVAFKQRGLLRTQILATLMNYGSPALRLRKRMFGNRSTQR
jgi:hypothetical protein